MSAPSSSSPVPGLTRRLHDIRTFQIARLANCKGPLSLHAELADELRQDLEDVARRIEVEREVAEIKLLDDPDGSGTEDLRKLDELKSEHYQCTLGYRTALRRSKKTIKESKGTQSRYELDTTRIGESDPNAASRTDEGTSSTRFAGADDEVQTRTNEVTDALKRTTQVMQAELERSVLSVRMLETSTETLRSTSTLYDTYTSLLGTSAQIVKALERADWQDRLLIGGAFLFFLLIVGWILKRRVLDKVVGGVGWWVGGSRKLVMMGLGGKGGAKTKAVPLKVVTPAVEGVKGAVQSFGASEGSKVVMRASHTGTVSTALSSAIGEVVSSLKSTGPPSASVASMVADPVSSLEATVRQHVEL